MNFLEPWGLIALSALIPVIALYFLKLKREERVVPSTLLWKKVIDDLQVNSPFQKLKYSLLLLLQMLLIALLAFALARPYLSLANSMGQKTILLIDTSASMSTRDAGDTGKLTRLEAAVRAARAYANSLRMNDEVMLAAFDKDVRQLCKFTSDRGLLNQLLSDLQPRDVETNADEAFETALALSEGQPGVQVQVLSDGCFGPVKLLKEAKTDVKGNLEDAARDNRNELMKLRLSSFRFIPYGSDTSDNAAITQIEARSRPVKSADADGKRIDALETQVFVMVENFAPKDCNAVLSLAWETGRSTKAISLKGRVSRFETAASEATGATSELSRSVEVFRLPLGTTGTVTAHIDSPKDRMSADDTASVVIGNSEGVNLLLVTKGNFFLEKALNAIRGLTITSKTPEEFSKEWDQKGQAATEACDACVFDETAPLSWSDGGALFIGALPPLQGFSKAEKPLEWPAVIDWDASHPVMRYVNFGTLTVAKSQAWTVPKTARVVVEGGGGPLMVAAESDRVRAVGISFDIFSSDWAYHRALPLFFRNVVPWLAEVSPRKRPSAQRTGEPLAVPPGIGATSGLLVRPDGSTPERVTLSTEHSTLIKGTEKAGLYHLKDLDGGKEAERTYAVNLASRSESDNAARGALKVGDVKMTSAPQAIEAKREIWRDLILAAGALLLLEWWVFHRRVGL